MKIPLVDLRKQHDLIRSEIDEAIKKIIDSNGFIGGHEVESFEEEFAKYCDRKFCISTTSGTSALHLLVLAKKHSGQLKKGDEVIIPANTFTATAEPFHLEDINIKFVDSDNNFLIDVEKLKETITDKTKLIVPVHLYGQSSNIDAINEIIKDKQIEIIEDCCQAHGAKRNNSKVPISGTGFFSFFPAKNLGTFGDGGAIVTDDEKLYILCKQIRDHGRESRTDSKYEHSKIGLGLRLDSLKAAILRIKLDHLDNWNNQKSDNVSLYNSLLENVGDIATPKVDQGNKHSYYVYTIRTKSRDELHTYLKENGIATQIYYPIPLHLQKAYSFLNYSQGSFPNSEKQAKEILSLPIYPGITNEQITYITNKIKEFYTK